MKLHYKSILFLTTILLTSIMSTHAQNIDKRTVEKVDIQRYMGKWYEIARYDHSFERNLEGVTATYRLKSNGMIEVINSGYKNSLSGKFSKAVGKAKIPNPKEPGKLKVSFFLWFYADYFILELDEVNYSYVLIGSSSDNYLWILSRTPQLPKATLDMLLAKAEKRGYDTSKLIYVKQPTR